MTNCLQFVDNLSRVIFSVLSSNSFRIFDLTQANFDANSAYFLHVTQNFGIFDQKIAKIGLTIPKS